MGAIKLLKDSTGIGLKEAKDAIEAYDRQLSGSAMFGPTAFGSADLFGVDLDGDGIPDVPNSANRMTANTSAPKPAAQKSGCYVATCVYGSYDCKEVWILRRYRDNYLDKRWYGRLFIKSYYAISPTVVKLFGGYDFFKRVFKPRLDCMVEKLSALGYEDTPYSDKY